MISGTTSDFPQSYRHLTFTSGLCAAAARTPQKVALVCGDRQLSYEQLVARVHRLGNAARSMLGIRPADHVAVIAPNSIEYLEIVCGLAHIGAAVVTPSPRLSAPELQAILRDSAARVVFVHPECEPLLDAARLTDELRLVRLGADYEALLAQAGTADPGVPLAEWATFAIPYTSGTTGGPKGVLLSHRSRTLGFLAYAAEYGIFSPDDSFLSIAPMCYGAGLAFAMAAIFLGGRTEILSKFDPQQVLSAIHSGRVTGTFMVPTHFNALFELPGAVLEALRGHRLRGIVSNAAPLSQALKERIVDYFGADLLHETYGSTEAGVVTNLRPRDQLRKHKCVGLPFIGTQIRLLRDDGTEAPAGEVGELYSHSPYFFNGYWNKPEQTREAFRDGWITVGDLARRDDEGYYYIVDRKKDMVISGGLNVYPREIEDVLNQHPALRESAVIGVEDSHWGERLVAYVVPAGIAPSVAAVLEFCRGRLADHKLPKEVHVIPALPRNSNGKVLKSELRVRYAQPRRSSSAEGNPP